MLHRLQDGRTLDDKIIPTNFNISSSPRLNWLSNFMMQTKKGLMFTDMNTWDYDIGIEDLIKWTACE